MYVQQHHGIVREVKNMLDLEDVIPALKIKHEIDQMYRELEDKKREIDRLKWEIAQKDREIARKNQEIDRLKWELAQRNQTIHRLQAEIDA